MGLLDTVLGIFGFAIGIPSGLLLGFFLFIYSEPGEVKDPDCRPIYELDTSAVHDLLPEIPFWVKHPDYDSVDWLNKFLFEMWPYLDKAICSMIRSMAKPIFSEYIGKFWIKGIEFENLSLGSLPPKIHGIKVCETNEKELIMEPAFKWAGNPNIVLVLKLMNLRITFQLVDLQIFLVPRITLQPLVPTFPCFASTVISMMDKPHVDFGMKVLGGDIMSIPGLYRFVQDAVQNQVSRLYLWPLSLEVPVLDTSSVAIKKPVGILHVNVVRGLKLLKMDLLGTSDPYVKLRLSDDRLPARKTTIKRKNLNPEWNEKFKLIVKDPITQSLELQVYDWDKVGGHDRLGMQVVPLKLLTAHETKAFTLDLLKNTNVNDPQNKKRRGQLVLDLRFVPFREDSSRFSGPLEGYEKNESRIDQSMSHDSSTGAGLLWVSIIGAEDVEGNRHNNPFALVLFRGEEKRTKMIRKTRDPRWNEEFPFMLEEPPLDEKVRIEVKSRRTGIGFHPKESLGHVDINLNDVVHNGRINQKYHLIDSKNGVIHVEIGWRAV